MTSLSSKVSASSSESMCVSNSDSTVEIEDDIDICTGDAAIGCSTNNRAIERCNLDTKLVTMTEQSVSHSDVENVAPRPSSSLKRGPLSSPRNRVGEGKRRRAMTVIDTNSSIFCPDDSTKCKSTSGNIVSSSTSNISRLPPKHDSDTVNQNMSVVAERPRSKSISDSQSLKWDPHMNPLLNLAVLSECISDNTLINNMSIEGDTQSSKNTSDVVLANLKTDIKCNSKPPLYKSRNDTPKVVRLRHIDIMDSSPKHIVHDNLTVQNSIPLERKDVKIESPLLPLYDKDAVTPLFNCFMDNRSDTEGENTSTLSIIKSDVAIYNMSPVDHTLLMTSNSAYNSS
jgi:hypothetical protein